jgi:hypothetical protein
MMMAAQEHEVRKVGVTTGFPRDDVMDIGKGHVRTAREPTLSVPAYDLSALRTGGEAPGPSLVHGVTHIVVDGHGDGGVTGDALHRLDVDQAVVLELGGQVA